MIISASIISPPFRVKQSVYLGPARTEFEIESKHSYHFSCTILASRVEMSTTKITNEFKEREYMFQRTVDLGGVAHITRKGSH